MVHNLLLPIQYVKHYCKNNLAHKALLVVDHAPGHPTTLQDMDNKGRKKIMVVFLPPNIASLLPSMDQGVIATFKWYSTHLVMSQ